MKMPINQQKGFSLVELAIVLVIIGVIIASVTQGRDLVRSAETKRIYSTWLLEWQLAYNNFFERTGRILGDTNGDGRPDAVDTFVSGDGSAATAVPSLVGVGLTEPTSNVVANNLTWNYQDSTGVQNVLTIDFTNTAATANRSVMTVTNVPYELAVQIDKIIDGDANGTTGSVLRGDGTADWDATSPVTVQTLNWVMTF